MNANFHRLANRSRCPLLLGPKLQQRQIHGWPREHVAIHLAQRISLGRENSRAGSLMLGNERGRQLRRGPKREIVAAIVNWKTDSPRRIFGACQNLVIDHVNAARFMTAASTLQRRARSAASNAPCAVQLSRIGTPPGFLDIASLPVQLGMPNDSPSQTPCGLTFDHHIPDFGREVSLSAARLEPSRRRRIFAEWTKFFPRS